MDSFDSITLLFEAELQTAFNAPVAAASAAEDTTPIFVDEERYGAGTAQAFCVIS